MVPPEDQIPMIDSVVLEMTCDEVQKWAGIPLQHLAEVPEGIERVVCAVSGLPDGTLPVHDQDSLPPEQRTGWGVHTLYVPVGVDLATTGYLQLLDQGGVDVAQYLRISPPAPAPRNARAEDPNEIAGGYARFDRGGSPATIQRSSEARYTARWSGDTTVGPMRFSVVGGLPADQIVSAARTLREGPAPDATVAAEAAER